MLALYLDKPDKVDQMFSTCNRIDDFDFEKLKFVSCGDTTLNSKIALLGFGDLEKDRQNPNYKIIGFANLQGFIRGDSSQAYCYFPKITDISWLRESQYITYRQSIRKCNVVLSESPYKRLIEYTSYHSKHINCPTFVEIYFSEEEIHKKVKKINFSNDFVIHENRLEKYIGTYNYSEVPSNVKYISPVAFKDCSSFVRILFLGKELYFESDESGKVFYNPYENYVSFEFAHYEFFLENPKMLVFPKIDSGFPFQMVPQLKDNSGNFVYFDKCLSVTGEVPYNAKEVGFYFISSDNRKYDVFTITNVFIPPSVESIYITPYAYHIEFTVDPNNKHFSSMDGLLYDKNQVHLHPWYQVNSFRLLPHKSKQVLPKGYNNKCFPDISRCDAIIFESEPMHYKIIEGIIFDEKMSKLLYYPSDKEDTLLVLPSEISLQTRSVLKNNHVKEIVCKKSDFDYISDYYVNYRPHINTPIIFLTDYYGPPLLFSVVDHQNSTTDEVVYKSYPISRIIYAGEWEYLFGKPIRKK